MYRYLFEGTPYRIESWHFMHVVGIVIVIILVIARRPKDLPVSRLGMFMVCLFLAYFGFIGAHLLYAILHSSPFYADSSFARALSRGGAAYLGTLGFGILFLLAFAKFRIKRISFLKVADYFLPFILLEQVFGRIGCFLTGCCYGKPTDLPWGCVFGCVDLTPRHPTQIYYAIFLLIIFFTSRHIYNKNPKPGIVFFGSLFMYGLFRFFGEFLRVDSPRVLGPITLAQVATIGIAAISGLGLFLCSKRS